MTAAVRQLREARGEVPVGRKIGFTNRTIWAEYNVDGPNWGYLYDRTVRDLAEIGDTFPLAALPEPRIEPEILFGLAAAPTPAMDERALLACIDWVAHGFEIVQSIFPGWRFTAPDTVAASAMHGAFLIGPRHPVAGAPTIGTGRSPASRSISCATARSSIAATPRMYWADRYRRCVISSVCSRAIRSIRRSQPARSSPPER